MGLGDSARPTEPGGLSWTRIKPMPWSSSARPVSEMNAGDLEVIEHDKAYLASVEDLKHPRVLEELPEDQVDAYDAIFLPGGHGPMQDLTHSETLGGIMRHMQAGDKLVVAVCHGPAGLLSAPARTAPGLIRVTGLPAIVDVEEPAS